MGQANEMIDDGIFYRSLVQALSILGPANASLVMRMLEEQGVVTDGRVDAEKLEPALASIFGDGSRVLYVRQSA
jgi:hypothetical protein